MSVSPVADLTRLREREREGIKSQLIDRSVTYRPSFSLIKFLFIVLFVVSIYRRRELHVLEGLEGSCLMKSESSSLRDLLKSYRAFPVALAKKFGDQRTGND